MRLAEIGQLQLGHEQLHEELDSLRKVIEACRPYIERNDNNIARVGQYEIELLAAIDATIDATNKENL